MVISQALAVSLLPESNLCGIKTEICRFAVSCDCLAVSRKLGVWSVLLEHIFSKLKSMRKKACPVFFAWQVKTTDTTTLTPL